MARIAGQAGCSGNWHEEAAIGAPLAGCSIAPIEAADRRLSRRPAFGVAPDNALMDPADARKRIFENMKMIAETARAGR
jgi:hypothetical protein